MVENGGVDVESRQQEPAGDSSSLDLDLSSLPKNCLPLVHQVAGHFYGKGRTKLGLLQTNDGLVLKPVQSPPRGEREHQFYKDVFLNDECLLNSDQLELRRFLPAYRGSLTHNQIDYIRMDDMAHGIQNPAVMDFKLGRITHDPEATPEKIQRQKSKYPPVERIGFQLIGMRVFDKETEAFSHYDKVFGRSLKEEDLIHGLALYYQFHQRPQVTAIREAIRRFDQIKAWFQKQTTYHFFSSSLIVIYEANLEELVANGGGNHLAEAATAAAQANVRVIMADFAHVFPAQGKQDTNYLFGLEKLIDYHKHLLSSDYQFKDVRQIGSDSNNNLATSK